MRYVYLLSLLFIYLPAEAQFTWETKASIATGSAGRWDAYGFSLNNKIYVAGGYTGSVNKKDFWEYDPATDTWTQKADVPGSSARTSAIAFAIGGKGYIGLGTEDLFSHPSLKDLWEYDPSTDSWTKKADLPDTGRKRSACFIVNNKAYVVGGSVNYSGFKSADVWEYDPATNQWTAKKDYPTGVEYAQAFTIGNTGFVTGGYNDNTFFKTTYQYDPVADSWTRKSDQCGDGRSAGVAFVLGGKAYVGLGVSRPPLSGSQVYLKDFCSYDMASDTWTNEADLPAVGRAYGIAAVANGKAYMGAGFFYNGAENYLNDWYALGFPADVSTINNEANDFVCYPNPAVSTIHISTSLPNPSFYIQDIIGQQVLSGKLGEEKVIDVSMLPTGRYLIDVSSEGRRMTQVIVIGRN